MNITKVIIPAAGLGTRFLPFTKAVPKELLPIINKPAIHYIVKEGIDSGVSQFLMITSKGKDSLINYFDGCKELENALKPKKRLHLIQDLAELMDHANFVAIRQPEPKGLGHAISMARSLINQDEYFGIMLPDDVIMGDNPALRQLIETARKYKTSVIAAQRVPLSEISQYGAVVIKQEVAPGLYEMASVVEKPTAQDAPSNLGIVGRYILHASLFDSIDAAKALGRPELDLTDAMNDMIKNGHKIYVIETTGTRYDLGRPMGWLTANIEVAMQDPEYAKVIRELVK